MQCKPPPVVTIDFETDAVCNRPAYPPLPCGMAIKYPGRRAEYLAWGHPTGNNSTLAHAKTALAVTVSSGLPVLFHNAKFDLEVARVHLGFDLTRNGARQPWANVHDTAFLLFLLDPHAISHGLKQAAHKHLDWEPEEQQVLAGWVWEARKQLVQTYGGRVTRGGAKGSVYAGNAAEWYSKAPGDLVGRYAIGDVDRTAALFAKLWPLVQAQDMGEAYDRERRLLPILMDNERVGIRCNIERLAEDVERYSGVLLSVEDRLRARLGCPDLNFDADQDYAHALIASGVVPEHAFARTAKRGDFKVSKETLTPDCFTDPRVASAVGYRNRLKTSLDMFMRPWLEQGGARDGWVSTNWHQTRGGGGGTRTGRPSTSNPNFLNISKDFTSKKDGYEHPAFLQVPDLPLVRRYLLPDKGGTWLHRDFSGQELRIFAHFEDGDLAAQYRRDPAVDVHAWVQQRIRDLTGVELERTRVKNVTFSRLYGGGVGAIERQAKCSSRAEAQQLADYHDNALPGRKALNDDIVRQFRLGEPIRTWGGRLYFCEPPRDGQSFEYKGINYLIQGSAADITKQAIIEWHDHPDLDPETRLLTTVYDEINITTPGDCAVDQMRVLKDVMNKDRIDVKMLSEGKIGATWGDLEKCA